MAKKKVVKKKTTRTASKKKATKARAAASKKKAKKSKSTKAAKATTRRTASKKKAAKKKATSVKKVTKKKAKASKKKVAAKSKATKKKAAKKVAGKKTAKKATSTKASKKKAGVASTISSKPKPKRTKAVEKRFSIFREPIVDKPEETQAVAASKRRRVKTGLKAKDLDYFRQRLLEKRRELIGDVTALSDAAGNNGGGNLSHMPLHMADVGTDNYEQEFTLELIESDRKLLKEINEALERIKEGTYGVCVESAAPIGRERLEAKPWARYSIAVARERERNGAR